MITVVYLLACVYCCCKMCFRFTSFKLRCYFTNWFPTNGRSILQWKIKEDRWNRGWLHQIRGRLLTWEAKVVCFLKIWWRLNEALLNYLEAITIGMKPTLMKERRFDGMHVDQDWNVCSPHSYIIKKVYSKFVIHIVDLVALIRCIWSYVCLLIYWMVFQQVKMSLLICWMVFQQVKMSLLICWMTF